MVRVSRVHQDLPVFVAATPLPRPVHAVTRPPEQVVCHGDLACPVVTHNLGHQCLNEAMAALLAGREIADHMAEYRADHIDRYERARTSGDIDALFVDREDPRSRDND